MKLLLNTFLLLMAGIHSALGATTYPINLLIAYPGVGNDGGTNSVLYGEPRIIPEGNTGNVICLFQQGDGNFRILRSASSTDCQNNVGILIFHSGFSCENGEEYFTKLQVDGNLVTRKVVNEDHWVWKSDSSQGEIVKYFRLVLNADDTLSILDKNGTQIWNSGVDDTVFWNRPLTLMTTVPNYPSRAWFVRPIKIRDRLKETYVCVIQQGDGNFRVIRGDDCEVNVGELIFHTGLSVSLPNNEKYWTHLQRDGNLVTRRELTKQWAWATCSGLGPEVLEEFNLVLTKDDTLAILDTNGIQIWESSMDESCFA